MPDFPCIHTLFEQQVDRTPDHIAVTCDGQHLRYRDLDAAANRLAGRLRALGVRPDTLVALGLDRSFDLIVAVLATLKAGGAYVPIDPSYPVARRRFYLHDSQAPVLVTKRALAAADGARTCVYLDEEAAALAALPSQRLPSASAPAHRAYVIYTSGSTGQPKGVEITHANVVRLFRATQPIFGFGPGDVLTLCHSAAFDFSVFELFGALLHGGRLVIVPLETAQQGPRLAALLGAERVTVLSQTPSAFRHLAPSVLALDTPPPLRCVVFGGEALPFAALGPWVARFGDSSPQLVNMYGITETTVHVTARRITARDVAEVQTSRIGRPLADLTIRLLDPQLQPVPRGAVGEIFVLGAGLARGYLGRAELTSARFLHLPDGQRAYRSGDLAQELADGDLVYLGRLDEQLKLRGFRIEPAEIRSALLGCGGVADAAVLGHGEGEAQQLIAYVVPAPGADLTASALRTALAARLPDHLVPAAFVVLAKLPLTLNGKLDTAALPPPHSARPPFWAPQTATEQALAQAMAHVLGLHQVGRDESFGALGGDSLRAAQVVRDLEQQHGRAPSIAHILAGQMVWELAAELDRATPRRTAPALASPEQPQLASATQLGIWLHAQRFPTDTAYNETLTLSTAGLIDPARLAQCIELIVARHPPLRTALVWREGALVQRIDPARAIPLHVEDLASLPLAQRAARADALATVQARAVFDPAAAPLARGCLVQLGELGSRFYLTVHHAICDACSLHNLATELATLYHTDSPREPALPLPRYPVTTTPRARADRPAPQWVLPTDSPRPASPGHEGARQPVFISQELAASLRALGVREGATLFMVLLAAWQTLLYRYSHSPELVVGSTIQGRPHAEQLPLIGPFFRMLPLSGHPQGGRSFRALLAELRGHLLAQLSGDGQQDEGDPLTSFETVFGMLPQCPRLPGGWQADLLAVDNGAAKYDLALLLQEQATGSLHGLIEYRTNLRRATTVARMVDHFLQLLAGIAHAPDRPLAALPLLTPHEQAQLEVWSNVAAAGAGSEELPDAVSLILAQARRDPEALAIEHPSGNLTYAQLVHRSAAIAHALKTRGIGPECLVAVHLPRSPELIASLLGVLVSGGAFLPLDPAQPAARIHELIADAQPALVITCAALRTALPPELPRLCLDTAPLAPPPSLMGFAPVPPQRLAYLLYTSGSTGRPKGVLIEHRGLSNLLRGWSSECRLGPTSRVLQFARISFDATIVEIFVTLSAGATLVLPGGHEPPLGAELLAILRDRRITTAILPPAVLAVLPDAHLPELTTLLVGGEACPPEVVARWASGRRFLNAYGPTEGTVCTTIAACAPSQAKPPEPPPIGRPLPGFHVHVLDPDHQPVPVGVPGELYIGGAGLARGYLNQPAHTAERFPCGLLPGSPATRLYRSGDRVRWRSDGQLEFLDRIDRQLKLRGYRIEPAEIEAALRTHPAVQDTLVVPFVEPAGHRTLCAYVVLHPPAVAAAAPIGSVIPAPGDHADRHLCATDDDTPSLQLSPASAPLHLAAFLRQRLPAYMVPSHIQTLPALPRTAHGKVDPTRLPPPAPSIDPPAVAADAAEPAAAAGSLEGRIAAIWMSVLGLAAVRPDVSFFELGGTSLLLAVVQGHLATQLGHHVALPVLFQNPTVRALAAHLRSGPGQVPTSAAAARAEKARQALTTQRIKPARREVRHD